MNNIDEEFDVFYNSYKKIIENNQKIEIVKINKLRNKCIMGIAMLTIVILILLIIFYDQNIVGYYYKIIIAVLCFIALIFLFIISIKILNKEKKKSCYLINSILYYSILDFLCGGSYDFYPNTQISENDFNKMKLFNMDYLKYEGNNLTTVKYQNKKLVICDVWLYDLVERIKTDSYYSKATNTMYITNYHYHDRVDIFKGLYYETTINRENNKYIYMIPNNFNDKFVQKNIYHYISYNGEKIDLENLEFSERYSVFSFDEIKSRYVLSLTLMEKINKIDRLIDNKKYFVFKSDGRVGIFVDKFQLEKIFKKNFNINEKVSKDYINSFFIKIHRILDIAQNLEDINQ